ncbi:Sterol 3-beta-glucosyltransferase UGT80A2 [Vitis vinifera]|uniref:Sterol 3-beta-glucosyltransferase UGT80A2 n=1 Tax=Vitis vinifera TaxID=29760 RepID=A0A438D4J6_VITVI|nr:Sterol 3-beta-glucosyltransferase UGT80A2 [Vitis vinifera]
MTAKLDTEKFKYWLALVQFSLIFPIFGVVHLLTPGSPTSEFPHPLSRVKQPAGYRLSYQIVDSMIWLGIRDMVNDMRKKKLKLRPVTYLSGSQGSDSDIPHGYIWSPHLVPKPKGYCFVFMIKPE